MRSDSSHTLELGHAPFAAKSFFHTYNGLMVYRFWSSQQFVSYYCDPLMLGLLVYLFHLRYLTMMQEWV